MEELLQSAGLTAAQAACYLHLLEHGALAPPQLAQSLNVTRTNAYKVLETLDDIGLVAKSETGKKIVYRAADPSALATLVAEQRNRAIALEHSVKEAMQQLRAKYQRSTDKSVIATDTGNQAIINAYERQAEAQAPIYFIKSRADIPFMGFETMDRLRRLPNLRHKTKRHGITPQALEVPGPQADIDSNLTRRFVPSEAYTAPVEWSKSGDELLITVFEGAGRVIRIQDALVADAFEQVWQLAGATLKPRAD
jgi:predicted transcriptional regulator